MFKQDLIKEILKDKRLDKDLVVVANTYQNISNEELVKKLNLLNAFVNKKLFKYFSFTTFEIKIEVINPAAKILSQISCKAW